MSDVALSSRNIAGPHTSSAAALAKAAERLLARVGHWPPHRWRASARPGVRVAAAKGAAAVSGGTGHTAATRADVMYELVQQVADAGAQAEGRSARPVPRLANDLVLPDQLRVMVADLLAAGSAQADELRSSCAALINATGRLL